MGKSRRKFMKKEKAKVKIKESKTVLPKGQNLTDTNFKVKKIVIKDQVKPHDPGDLLTSRKLNVKDLLTRLGHHNINMRKEALEGINELLSNYQSEVITSYLAILLPSLSKLILDPTGNIRKESTKLMANIFSKTKYEQLEPFFSSVSSYLICGLTHIDCAIREDSLYFLDNLLNYVPQVCAKAASKLLPVCLDLVSHSNSVNRTLSLNLDSSSTSLKWRIKVLSRVRLLLSTLIQSTDIGENKESDKKDVPLRKRRNMYFLTSKNVLYSNLQLDCFDKVDDEVLMDFSLKNFSDAIIPLLIDMFIEVVPQREDSMVLNQDVCTLISEEEANILKNVVDIIKFLWEIIDKEENSNEKLNALSKNHGQNIISKLIKGRFPYELRSKRKRKEETNDLSCRLQNLTLCKIVILFGNASDWINITPYLKNLFRNADSLNKNECDLFVSCISHICNYSNNEESKYFLNSVFKTVMNSKSSLSGSFFLFLTDVALNNKFDIYHSESSFISWLKSLPKLLTKSKISALVLEKIRLISLRNYEPFSESLDTHIESILDNIPRIQVEGMDKEKGQFVIAAFLYQVKDWDEELVESINKAIENEYWGSSVTSFIKDIVNVK
ncbi:hypothetical protein O3M35_007463 [Rhynocoris fuscipes]